MVKLGTQAQYSFVFEIGWPVNISAQPHTSFFCSPYLRGTIPSYTFEIGLGPVPNTSPLGNIYVKGPVTTDGVCFCVYAVCACVCMLCELYLFFLLVTLQAR